MKHGKLIDGKLHYAPNPLIIEEKAVFTNDDAVFLSAGYKRIIETPCPQDGKVYQAGWQETALNIIGVWMEITDPVPSELDRLDALEAAIAEMAEEIYHD